MDSEQVKLAKRYNELAEKYKNEKDVDSLINSKIPLEPYLNKFKLYLKDFTKLHDDFCLLIAKNPKIDTSIVGLLNDYKELSFTKITHCLNLYVAPIQYHIYSEFVNSSNNKLIGLLEKADNNLKEARAATRLGIISIIVGVIISIGSIGYSQLISKDKEILNFLNDNKILLNNHNKQLNDINKDLENISLKIFKSDSLLK